jgi:hypothetical protein
MPIPEAETCGSCRRLLCFCPSPVHHFPIVALDSAANVQRRSLLAVSHAVRLRLPKKRSLKDGQTECLGFSET